MSADTAARRDWRPDGTDCLLLQAALLPGEPGQNAWQAWLSRTRLDEAGQGAYCLLPELHPSLAARGMTASVLARLKGIVRKTWLENQLRRATLAHLVQILQLSGLEPLLLRGAIPPASTDRQRNTSDMACAVRLEQAPACLAALERAGWHATRSGAKIKQPWRYLRGLTVCAAGSRHAIELRWHAVPGAVGGGAEPGIWQRSILTPAHDGAARVPGPTDQLVLACLDGTTWRAEPDWRWAIDAAALVRAGAIDWDELVQTCQQGQCVLPIRAALEFLASILSSPVPGAVLGRLGAAPISASQTRAFELSSQRDGIVGSALKHWQEYQFLAAGQPGPPWGFVRYLQTTWCLASAWQVPIEAARRSLWHVDRKLS